MRSNPNCNGNRRVKVALRTTCVKNVKFTIIKIRTGCQCCKILSLQLKSQLGRTKPSTGPRVGHRGTTLTDVPAVLHLHTSYEV